MYGRDPADLLDALLRQLAWLRPPAASIVFRRKAWREFERAIDPLGLPRERTEEHDIGARKHERRAATR